MKRAAAILENEIRVKKVILTTLRVVILVMIYIVLFIIASSVTTPPELAQHMTHEQASQSAAMLPVVSLLMTLVVVWLALRSRWQGWRLAGTLFVVLYGISTFLSQIETAVFPAVANRLLPGMLTGFFISGLILAAPFSLFAVWILGRTRKDSVVDEPNERLVIPLSEWAWKLALIAVLYVIIYFTFGYFVAWRTPGLPEFYGGKDPGSFIGQLGNVMRDTPWLPFFQILRSMIWTAVAVPIIRMMKGKAWETILAVAFAFSVLMAAQLLFPNPIMPAEVANAHLRELLSSNFLFGALVASILLWRPSLQQGE
jgi:hypothetical protein